MQETTHATYNGSPLEGPLALTVRYTRKDGGSDSANIVGGVANALQGILYANDNQLREIEYAEHPGEQEHYEVGIVRAGLQVPNTLAPVGDIGILQGDPAVYFPDDEASRWMLNMLAANHDIGLTMKLLTPLLAAPASAMKPYQQYRTSHVLYFFRLWIGHLHEGWCAFNRKVDHAIVKQLRAAAPIMEAYKKVADLRGRKVGEVSVGKMMEQCRHTAFHYTEKVADRWRDQLAAMGKDFPLCITHSEYRDVDSRWLIADEYVLSRLNRLDFGNPDLHVAMRDMTNELIALIRTIQGEYFKLRNPSFGTTV